MNIDPKRWLLCHKKNIYGRGITRQINIVYLSNLVNTRKVARAKRRDGNGLLIIAYSIRVERRGIR
jgi:hypothetical protein